jgi:predicted nucleic acid-binding protein
LICLDASVIVQWLLPEAHSAEVESLLRATLAIGDTIVAPPLLPFEIANALRKRVVRNLLPAQESERLLQQFDTLPISLRTPNQLHQRALVTAKDFGLPAIYDGCYIVLAQQLGCDFWTDDERLLKTLNNRLPFVRWIHDYVLPTPSPANPQSSS